MDLSTTRISTMTAEERRAVKLKAQKERKKQIRAAIKAGATVQELSCPITADDQETSIVITGDTCIIDTTFGPDITTCMKKKYEIIGVTFYNKRVVGVIFRAPRSKITFRN